MLLIHPLNLRRSVYFGLATFRHTTSIKMLPPFVRYGASLLLVVTSFTLLAQDKTEVERGVPATEVPLVARDWLHETYLHTKRLRWYLERSSDGTSYEAKFRHHGAWHSVEFGEEGMLQDIEIRVSLNDLPETVRRGMTVYFDTTYTKYRIRKIQQQLSGPSDVVRAVIQNEPAEGVTYRYEVEFYGKNDRSKALWEGLFDYQGQLQQRRRIVLRPTDNLNY